MKTMTSRPSGATGPARRSKALVTGVSVAAGLSLVGAMGAAAKSPTPQPQTVIHRVVVPQIDPTVIVVRTGAGFEAPPSTVADVPLPAMPTPDPVPTPVTAPEPPPPTQSAGS